METGLRAPAVKKQTQRARVARQARANPWSYIYLAPMVVLVASFIIYPSFASLGYTFYDWSGIGEPSQYVGLDNFQRVMTDGLFWHAFLHTFIYAGVLVPVQLTLALILALVLNNRRLRGATVYRAIYFIPVVMAPAIIGVVVQLLLTNFGEDLNRLLINVHVIHRHIDWLGDPSFALACIIAVGIWNTLGYNLVYFLAALQSVPAELYEAAKIDGANPVAQFFYITIPMLRNIGLIIVTLAILGSLQIFDLVQVLTGGGPYFATDVVNTYIYHQAFSTNGAPPNIGFASAASFFYGLILLGLTTLQFGIARAARRTPGARSQLGGR